MGTLLTWIVIILGIIAIVRLIRVFELTSEIRGEREDYVSLSDIRTNAKLLLGFLVLFFAFFLYSVIEWGPYMLPEPASRHGVEVDALMDFNMIIIISVFVITHILLFYFSYRYYFRPDRKAVFFAHSNKLEFIWTSIPAIVLFIIIVYGLITWNRITDMPGENALYVELYSKQFDWTARYSGSDNKLGDASVRKVEGANTLGMDSTDPRGWDDVIVKGEMYLPVNRQVEFQFRSQDVIHSAYMPHFRAQMNTVPGMTTRFKMTPTITTEEMKKKTENPDFEFILLCNKVCGAAHYNMQMNIIVVSEEEYEAWLAEQAVFNEENLGSRMESETAPAETAEVTVADNPALN